MSQPLHVGHMCRVPGGTCTGSKQTKNSSGQDGACHPKRPSPRSRWLGPRGSTDWVCAACGFTNASCVSKCDLCDFGDPCKPPAPTSPAKGASASQTSPGPLSPALHTPSPASSTGSWSVRARWGVHQGGTSGGWVWADPGCQWSPSCPGCLERGVMCPACVEDCLCDVCHGLVHGPCTCGFKIPQSPDTPEGNPPYWSHL